MLFGVSANSSLFKVLIGVSGVNNFYWGISLGIILHIVMHTCIIYIYNNLKWHVHTLYIHM